MSHKAIVVFYMHGGHDGYNMFVPLDNYQRYADYRGNLAHQEGSLIPLGIGQNNLAIHGHFSRTAEMIQSGIAAPILGTGNLVEPVTYNTLNQKLATTPPFLHSHSHQQSFNKGAYDKTTGWAGRMLDLWYEDDYIPQSISPALTMAQDLDLVSSATLGVSQIRSEGESWYALQPELRDIVYNLSKNSDYSHIIEQVAQKNISNSIEGQEYLQVLFSQFEESGKLNTSATIASKLIAAAGQLGHERQIIHVALPGNWDTHRDQMQRLNDQYITIDHLFADFILELEQYGVADNVVCVTASDFGRSLKPNSVGTDHGWGNNQLVFGKPVLGNQAIGEFIDYDNPDYWTKSKRLIPKLADIQTYATLGKWFGLNDEQLNQLFPDLSNFDEWDLGFMPT